MIHDVLVEDDLLDVVQLIHVIRGSNVDNLSVVEFLKLVTNHGQGSDELSISADGRDVLCVVYFFCCREDAVFDRQVTNSVIELGKSSVLLIHDTFHSG